MSHVSHEWYTADEKNRIVQDYLASGLSLRKYSEGNDVKLPTLSAWIRKYRIIEDEKYYLGKINEIDEELLTIKQKLSASDSEDDKINVASVEKEKIVQCS